MFGGETSFEDNKERDKKKRVRSAEHGVKVFDWKYDTPVNRANVKVFLDQHKIKYDDSITVSGTIADRQTHPMVPVIQKPVRTKANAPQTARPSPFVIRQFDTDGRFIAEYASVAEASQKCNMSEYSVKKALRGERKTGGGYMWQRCPRESRIENIAPVQYAENTGLAKKVLQINKDGTIIAEYVSIGQAVKQTGVSGISAALAGTQKTAGGYVWRYQNLDEIG